MPITIDFLANTAEFLRGAKKAQTGLEDVGDSLDDLTREANRSRPPTTLELLEESAEDARRATERLEDSFTDLARKARSASSDAGADIGDKVRAGTDRAGEGLDELKSEASGTAREAAASFGSIEDAGGALQEVLANAFAGFGPAGAVAGIAAAAGVGLVITAATDAAAAINEAKERTGELALEIADAGGDIEAIDLAGKIRGWAVELADSKEWWEFWQRGAVSNLDKATGYADKFGTSAADMLRGLSGSDAAAATRSIAAIKDRVDESAEALTSADRVTNEYGESTTAAGRAHEALERASRGAISALETQGGVTEEATRVAEILTEVTAADTAAAEANAVAQERRQQAIDTVNDAYDEAAGAAADYVSEETGLFDTGAYITAMQAREQAIRDYQTTLATSPLTAEAKAFLDSQGVDAAAQFLAGYKSATPEQQAELNRIWSEAGKTDSGVYAGAVATGIAAEPAIKGPQIKPNIDMTDYETQKRTVTGAVWRIPMKVELQASSVGSAFKTIGP